MTLTPEQFNKLATKDDLNNFKQEIKGSMVTKQEFHNVMDVVIKKLDDIEHAFVSNQAAHNGDVAECHFGCKSRKSVKFFKNFFSLYSI